MKTKLLITTVVTLACACTVMAEDGNSAGSGSEGDQLRIGDQQQIRDQLETCNPDLEQKQTRLRECLPEEVKAAIEEMTQARKKHQQQLREKQKAATECAAEDREQLREQLREQIKEQAQAREQLRERLREMRECLPTHDELMEQAKEQARTRMGEE